MPERRRWWIVGLLFLATVLNYLDRQALSILSATLRHELHLIDSDYANAISGFLLSYVIMYIISGRIVDHIGVRLGAGLCVGWWSVASMLTGLAIGPKTLLLARFLLGLGEPGIYPASLKACSEWFPQRLRATAWGIVSSGIAIGALIAAPLIAWLTLRIGWRYAFFIPGLAGLIWLLVWLRLYRPSPSATLSVEDHAKAGVRRRPWIALIKDRRVLALSLSKFVSDPVWYFYLFWLPDYLQRVRHLSLAEIGLYAWIPFAFADLGMVSGGMISDFIIRRGWPAPQARFTVLLGLGLLAPFGALVGVVETTASAITITCMIAFISAAWMVNVNILASDLSDRTETASWMGVMGASGSLGGLIFAQLIAFCIARLGYSAAFMIAATMHPAGVVLLYALLRPGLSSPRRSAA